MPYARMKSVYEDPVRAAEESNTHSAMSCDAYSWTYRGKPVKVRIIYRRGRYELRFAGAVSIRVPDAELDRAELSAIISRCRKWEAVNWL